MTDVVPTAGGGDKDEDRLLKLEKWSWWFTAFCRGPDTILMLVWYPVLLELASSDSVCGPFQGISSGADALKCSADASFNNTLWNSFNGSSCTAVNEITQEPYLVHDPSLPGCASALQAYRNATGYTCNCSSVYSYVLGIRTGNLQSMQ